MAIDHILRYVWEPDDEKYLKLGWVHSAPMYVANGSICWIMVWLCSCEMKVPEK